MFYEELVKYWKEICCFQLSESIWFRINKIDDPYENDGKLIHFEKQSQLGLLSELYFQWMQLIDCLPVKWKALIKNNPSPINQEVSKYTLSPGNSNSYHITLDL